nr:MAG TPA: hypothetical protein [Bacteriophage sp.]
MKKFDRFKFQKIVKTLYTSVCWSERGLQNSNESSMLSWRVYPYLHLAGYYCNSSGRWEMYG